MSDVDDALPLSDSQARAAELGRQPALVERFGIRGLYGYRTIHLSSEYAATILIAKNGMGKTTLLGALDAFLKLELYRLRELEFTEIFCQLRGIESELVLSHDDLVSFLQIPAEGELAKLSSRTGVEKQRLFQFLLSDFDAALENWVFEHDATSTVNLIMRSFSHDPRAAKKAISEAYASLFLHNARLSNLSEGIRLALENHEIVYLPTYRRVELSITDQRESRRRRGRIKSKFNIVADGLHTGDIQFGLGDISDRLVELNDDIIRNSNLGYREISENIINELIRGFDVSEHTVIPGPEDLKLFFSRLESGSRVLGPYYSISAPDFERIYSGEGVPAESRKFLTYFLGKLNGIIEITKTIEKPVEEFINICNKYLSSIDPSTSLEDEFPHKHLPVIDGKTLKLNRTNLSVHVESVPARTPISLDALSSGEKQMVSLFAKMYLYPKKKVVLIDEPELSLSIDWQKEILVDVLLSPNCEQIVAITHSPFVFDNSLESFAKTLGLQVQVQDRTVPEPNMLVPNFDGDNRP